MRGMRIDAVGSAADQLAIGEIPCGGGVLCDGAKAGRGSSQGRRAALAVRRRESLSEDSQERSTWPLRILGFPSYR